MRRAEPVSPEEMTSVFRAAVRDSSAYGARDAAMLGLFLCSGVCGEDLLTLRYADYDPKTAKLSLPGASGETVALSDDTTAALERWLSVRGETPGPLFNPVRRPNRIDIRGIGKSQFCMVMKRRIGEAGVAPFTPDDVTRTRRLHASGQWFGYETRVKPAVSIHVTDETSRVAHDSMKLIVRVLSPHARARRTALIARLDFIALRVSGGRRNAFTFGWCSLRFEDLGRICRDLDELGTREAHFSRNALRLLVREGVRIGVMDSGLAAAMGACCPRRTPQAPALRIQAQDVAGIMRRCLDDASARGARDAVLVGVLWETGLRAPEALRLNWMDGADRLACVHRAGGAWGHCLTGLLGSALERWRDCRAAGTGKLLLSVTSAGRVTSSSMTSDQIGRVLEVRGRAAGLGRVLAGQLRASSIWYAMTGAARKD